MYLLHFYCALIKLKIGYVIPFTMSKNNISKAPFDCFE